MAYQPQNLETSAALQELREKENQAKESREGAKLLAKIPSQKEYEAYSDQQKQRSGEDANDESIAAHFVHDYAKEKFVPAATTQYINERNELIKKGKLDKNAKIIHKQIKEMNKKLEALNKKLQDAPVLSPRQKEEIEAQIRLAEAAIKQSEESLKNAQNIQQQTPNSISDEFMKNFALSSRGQHQAPEIEVDKETFYNLKVKKPFVDFINDTFLPKIKNVMDCIKDLKNQINQNNQVIYGMNNILGQSTKKSPLERLANFFSGVGKATTSAIKTITAPLKKSSTQSNDSPQFEHSTFTDNTKANQVTTEPKILRTNTAATTTATAQPSLSKKPSAPAPAPKQDHAPTRYQGP